MRSICYADTPTKERTNDRRKRVEKREKERERIIERGSERETKTQMMKLLRIGHYNN